MKSYQIYAACLIMLSCLSIFALHNEIHQLQGFEIRSINMNDEEEINALYDFFSNEDIQNDTKETTETIRRYIRHNKLWLLNNQSQNMNQIIIAKKDKKIYGAAIAYPFNQTDYWIKVIAVDKSFRRQKVGSALFHALEKILNATSIQCKLTTEQDIACKFIESQKPIQIRYLSMFVKAAGDFSQYNHVVKPYDIYHLDCHNEEMIDKICDLLSNEEIKRKTNSLSWTSFKKSFTSSDIKALFVKDNMGNPCAVLCYNLKENNTCQTQGLAVRKDCRRQGVAKTLIETLQRHVFIHGYSEVHTAILHDNLAAINCFKDAGFVEQPEKTLMIKKELKHYTGIRT